MSTATENQQNSIRNPLRGKTPRRVAPPFWSSSLGRNVLGGITVFAGSACFGGYTFIHSWFLYKYKSIVQLYRNGFETPLRPDVSYRCQEALSDVRLNIITPELVEFFSVVGMDVFHAGSTKLRHGSIIGIPRNFMYETKEEIEKNDIVVENKNIEWGSDGGQLLQESLIFSPRAQKFAIAREMVMTDTHHPYVRGGLGAFGVFTYFFITRTVNDRFQGFQRPKSFRIFIYTLAGTFTFGLWSTLTDMATKYYEKWADNKVGSIGLNYAQGGVEFYAKTLQRNIALRSLMGSSGEKKYTFYGNDVEFVRQKHVPFTERKSNMEVLAEKLASTPVESDQGAGD